MTQLKSRHFRIDLHYMLVQAGYWGMSACICAYQTALLLGRGFSNSDAGLILAVRCLAGVFSEPLLGMFSDRHPNIPLKYIAAFPMLISLAAGLVLIFYPTGLIGSLILFALIGAFELSAYPLIDSMAIQFINDGVPIHYSMGRGIGSMAFAVCSAVLGSLTAIHTIELVLPVHAALVVVVILLILSFPTHKASTAAQETHSNTEPQNPLSLLAGHPRFTVSLFAALFGVMGIMSLSNFLFNITTAKGGTSADMGNGLFIMGTFELLTAFIFPRLRKRFGVNNLLILSMAFCTLKGVAFFLAPSVPFLLAAQALQILGYGLFNPTAVFLVDESVPAADRVQGQTLMMVASNGIGGVLGGFFSGRALDFGGVPALLLLCTASCLLATVLAFLSARLPKDRAV